MKEHIPIDVSLEHIKILLAEIKKLKAENKELLISRNTLVCENANLKDKIERFISMPYGVIKEHGRSDDMWREADDAWHEKMIQENAKLREYKEDIEATYKRIMDEECPTDEVHCTCVPLLIMEIKKLKERLKPIEEVYSLFSHLDILLSDAAWIDDTSPFHHTLYDCWQAIKKAREVK